MKKIISFSLWGDDPIYNIGAIRNAELAKKIYSGWVCRYYVGKSTPADTIEKLKTFDNVEIIEMDEEGDWTGMFWRFYPASEESVDVVISSLPLANFPFALKRDILQQCYDALKPSGLFIQFQYSLIDYKLLKKKFSSVERKFTPLNIPPAFIYVCRK